MAASNCHIDCDICISCHFGIYELIGIGLGIGGDFRRPSAFEAIETLPAVGHKYQSVADVRRLRHRALKAAPIDQLSGVTVKAVEIAIVRPDKDGSETPPSQMIPPGMLNYR